MNFSYYDNIDSGDDLYEMARNFNNRQNTRHNIRNNTEYEPRNEAPYNASQEEHNEEDKKCVSCAKHDDNNKRMLEEYKRKIEKNYINKYKLFKRAILKEMAMREQSRYTPQEKKHDETYYNNKIIISKDILITIIICISIILILDIIYMK